MKFSHAKIISVSTATLLAAALSATVVPAASAAPIAASPMVVSSVNAGPVDSYNAQVLALINNERVKVGAMPVVWNQAISNVSQDWANHLGVATLSPTFDFATIHRPDAGGNEIPAGSTWYREIIAFASTPDTIVNWWMNSPAHKAAMLDPNATDIGIGYVIPSSGPYAGWHQVVANLAAYPSSSTTTPTAPSSGVPAGTQYKTTIQLNLRSGPGTNYDILGYGVTGTIVTATGNTNGIWYEVKMGTQTGWMSSDYLTKYADPTPPATQSAIAVKAASLNGALGTATTGEVYGLKGGGGYQNYQSGAIVWSPSTGAHISVGAIRAKWAETGFENGGLGYPTTDEIGGLRDGGVYQNYQGGAIIWSPATGAHVSVGAIRGMWASTGFENGGLGYPTTDEVGGLKNGGVYQNYQGGAIVWSPATGAHISVGGIRNAWAAQGFENGRLGYPTSNEYSDGAGGTVQDYQGGKITWTPRGVSVSYN